MIYHADKSLMHFGVGALDGAPGRGSGRYPLGSGKEPNQHSGDLYDRINELRKKGMSDVDIATAMGLKSTTELRAAYSNARANRKNAQAAQARKMLDSGMTKTQVARELGMNESSLRSLMNENRQLRRTIAQDTADFLRKQVDEKGVIDVGTGVEYELNNGLGISREKMNQALDILKSEGYELRVSSVEQATNPGKRTILKVLCPPGTPAKESYNYENIHTITDYTLREDEDGSIHFDRKFEYPASMDSSRLMIRYRDDVTPDGHTSVEKDGTIEIRPGVKDLDLGGSRYAQVRILVDNDKYIKGMAHYSDDLPDGIDVIFNTNKTPGKDPLKSIKKDDPNNPFGALLREEGGQYHYIDENGERKLGLINKTRTEGDWGEWADSLSSQFLSKQNKALIKQQLNATLADKKAEYDDILTITNPTVRRQLLSAFAEDCDASAVHLKAAALPRQKYQVILPIPTMDDNEIYAPNYKDGETVALIRYPHGGTFEIPILKVNNKQADARRVLGTNPKDAVGINANVAARLSGADFDGDTVMVIPCNSPFTSTRITATKPLDGLQGFDPKDSYGYTSTSETVNRNGEKVTHYYRDGREFKPMTKSQTGLEMGKVSNLITDMTLKGATDDELARAVRHSMVVIDAEKHKLDWRQSEKDNDIASLKALYQTRIIDEDGTTHTGGASTLISRASADYTVLKRKGAPRIDKETGEVSYHEVVETYTDKHGKTQTRMQKSTQMAEVKDAHKLSSGTAVEEMYADYANSLKAMANTARKEFISTGTLKYEPSARETYREEVDALTGKLFLAKKNAPRERQAQLAAQSEVQAIKRSNPNLSKKEIKKISQVALSEARNRFNAHRYTIDISQREWDAIQSGAIHDSMLTQILRFADADKVRQYATPRPKNTLSAGQMQRLKSMAAMGYTQSQIADTLGVSASTVNKYLHS